MTQFVLIDLLAQRVAVLRITEDMTPDETLEWIGLHGDVRKLDNGDDVVYRFTSHLGIIADFTFGQNDQLIVIR
ncbi:MAG: hypothetical protein GYB68_14820 [Chloroflexi bacterium]|nr:hypothetical protein [Chloroflexota bacterium]